MLARMRQGNTTNFWKERAAGTQVKCYSLSGDVLAEVTLGSRATFANLRLALRSKVSIETNQSLRFFAIDGGELEESSEGKIPLELTVVVSAREWVVTACADGSAAMWDANTGEWCKSLFGHDLSVFSVALSPDLCSIATGSSDHTVRLWSVQRQSWRLTLRGHRSGVLCVNFSGDGQRLVSASSDKTARVWSAGSFGECLSVLRGHRKDVSWVTFSPEDSEILTSSDDRSVIFWDAETFLRLQTVGQLHRINCVSYACDGHHIALAFRTKEVVIWRVERPLPTAGLAPTVLRQRADAFAVAWHPQRMQLAVALADGSCSLWDALGGQLASLQGHAGKVFSVTFSSNGLLATASADGTAKLWSCESYGCLRSLEGHTAAVNAELKHVPHWPFTVGAEATPLCPNGHPGDIRGNLLQASHYEDNPMSKTAARPQLPERRQEGGRGPQRAYDALMPLMKPTTDEVVWEMVQHFNDFTTSAVSKCKTVTHDAVFISGFPLFPAEVYQRFSGYAARHRREAALGVLQSLQDTSLSNLCGQALSTEESIARNAYGDGYILEVVEQHLGVPLLLDTLGLRGSGSTLATVAVTAVAQLHHIFEQLADAVARLGVGGARNETRSLTRFLASLVASSVWRDVDFARQLLILWRFFWAILDGFPATVSLDLLRVRLAQRFLSFCFGCCMLDPLDAAVLAQSDSQMDLIRLGELINQEQKDHEEAQWTTQLGER
ncbi:unnamed protein product [Cladocopium goreaui]|uniref:Vegetative incompatibility protein HET-E-1 n=1 Tax=Cladocopium goreaui TaxID=2562237 RepID=A0A9P1C0F4_9DINO|nr:unnamed protein product [Cladocopium goreaui]